MDHWAEWENSTKEQVEELPHDIQCTFHIAYSCGGSDPGNGGAFSVDFLVERGTRVPAELTEGSGKFLFTSDSGDPHLTPLLTCSSLETDLAD